MQFHTCFLTFVTLAENLVLSKDLDSDAPGIRRHKQDVGIESGQSPNANPLFEKGFGCGTISMRPNHVIQIQSTNFGIGDYFNNEGCSWTFTSTECALSAYCPCFDLPTSFGCFEDYLKINHQYFSLQSERFCGKNYPVGVYRAASKNSLTIQFKSDNKGTAKGFLCYVRCTATGMADPVAPSVNCPLNSRNPYGFPP